LFGEILMDVKRDMRRFKDSLVGSLGGSWCLRVILRPTLSLERSFMDRAEE